MNKKSNQVEDSGRADRGYSAVILYFRRGLDICLTIDNLLAQSVSPCEVVVVDNWSQDGVMDEVASRYPSVTFVETAANLGYAGGMNFGFSKLQTSCEWVLFLTHEVRMEPECIELMLAASRECGAHASQVGPVLKLLGTSEIWSVGGEITRFGGVAHHERIVPETNFSEVDWLDGSCHLVNSNDFASIGLFDNRFHLYWEDVDLSVRLAQRGMVVVATKASAFQSTSTTPVYYKSRNRTLFWRSRKSYLRAIAGAAAVLVAWLSRDIPDRSHEGRVRGQARLAGMRDGFTTRLREEFGSTRDL